MDGLKLNPNSKKSHITEAAADLLDEGKKLANELYDDGLKRVNVTKKEAEVYTDELLEQVRENPLKSVLIAGGIGFLLSALLRK
jgi:ElaB/YqjD/DUF883 family membrane-anchored ribosome-binding protein